MSLRPRYSLLTLLILTALVAGGVKLWYGPHHVVVWPDQDEEVEYTFTRHWSMDKHIDGPIVRRFYEQGQLRTIKLRYLSREQQVPAWGCDFYNISQRHQESRPSTTRACEGESPLAPVEQQLFQAAIEREQQRLRDAGLRSDEYQGNLLYDPHRVDIFP